MVWLWKRFSLLTRCLAMLLLTVLAAGCGDSRPAPAPVTGVVTFKGAPVEDAHVVFYTEGTRPAMATTDAKGQFSLLTWEPGDGALAGQAVVCVTKEKTVKRKSDDPYASSSVSELPEIYRIPSKSPLRAEVKPNVPNEFKFELVN